MDLPLDIALNLSLAVGPALDREKHIDPRTRDDVMIRSALYAMYVVWVVAVLEAWVGEYHRVLRELVVHHAPDEVLILDALWGLRVAFTHSDGDLSRISSRPNKELAIGAATVFPDCVSHSSELDRIFLEKGIVEEARTFLARLNSALP